MTDARTGQPSEEELRAYLESLREAKPEEVVVQAFGILATASEVKLGREDARTLIDGMSALVDAVGDRMSDELAQRMRSTVSQLQLAHVQLEKQQAAESAQKPQEDAPQQPSEPSSSTQQRSKATDRLWIPGRD